MCGVGWFANFVCSSMCVKVCTPRMLDAVDVYILIDDYYLCAIYSSSVWLDPTLEIAAFGFSKIVTPRGEDKY